MDHLPHDIYLNDHKSRPLDWSMLIMRIKNLIVSCTIIFVLRKTLSYCQIHFK